MFLHAEQTVSFCSTPRHPIKQNFLPRD